MGKWIIAFLLLLFLIIFTFHFTEVQRFAVLVQHIKPWWFSLAVLCQLGTYISLALIWWLALWVLKEKIRFLPLMSLSFAQLFVNQTLPSSGLSGAMVVTQFLAARTISKKAIGLTIALNIFGRQIAYLFVFILSVIILWMNHSLGKGLIYLALIFTVLMVLVLIAAIYLWRFTFHNNIPNFIKRFEPIVNLLLSIKKISPYLLFKAKIILPSISLFVLIFVFDSLTLWVILYGWNQSLNFGLIFAAQVMSTAIASLSFIPGGLVIFEGSMVGILHILGLSYESAFAATILFRGFTYWLPMIPGFIVIQREIKKGDLKIKRENKSRE